ncbi:hypothetical protein pipiens_020076, partial [Culex pipiens pipiens]
AFPSLEEKDSPHNPFADGAWPSPRLSRATIRSGGGVLARSVPSTRESSAQPKWWPAATSRKRVRNPTTTCFATRTARCTFRTRAAAFGAGHERTRTRTTRQSVVGCRSIQNV